ncbi:MAG: ABC transporter ATP-binding protein [Azospira oryzae]|jgi:iron complex transport system ATP-binding protein|nr:MAG: ABC transporter ATP-binding protein [Azospira oryzae]
MMNRKPFLETQRLSVGYTTSKVLFNDINLSLQAGELVCFMGPNGIGKSTLIRTLAGLQEPLSGKIIRGDEKKVAVVLTDKIAASHMTVRELITYGRYPYVNWNITLTEADLLIIDQSIDTVHIRHLLDKKLYELSDGQMQMVMVARALTQETPVILMDEPTAHLDLNNRVEIMNLLRQLTRNSGKAILVATHELDLALQTADLIWLTMPDQSIKTGIPEDLVLDGSIDSVFQFKGFDLKTGKVAHEVYRTTKVNLIGDGPTYLWTRNALERSGLQMDEAGEIDIVIDNGRWRIKEQVFTSLKDLLDAVLLK